MVLPAGLGPATVGLVGRRSLRLSYGSYTVGDRRPDVAADPVPQTVETVIHGVKHHANYTAAEAKSRYKSITSVTILTAK
jgi:hypothetical protein